MDQNNTVLKNIHLDSNVSKKSKEILQKIGNDLKVLFFAEWIDAKVEDDHHVTYAYFNEISSQEIGDIIWHLYSLKNQLQGKQMLNKDISYDQSIHQVTIWPSNVTGNTHVVLTPHNPESIYKELIISKHISPHINLAKIDLQDQTKRSDIRNKVKRIVKKYIQEDGLYWDISKINIHM